MCRAVSVFIVAAMTIVASVEGSACSICLDVVGAVANATGSAGCGSIDPIVDHFCSVIPPAVVGPALCEWLVQYECPKIVRYLNGGKTAEEACTAIGLCSSGPCQSFGRDKDNGHCTAELANSTQQWRLEWDALPWWKNKGCNPPKHIGIDPVYCSDQHIGCCLSGWTPHLDKKMKNMKARGN